MDSAAALRQTPVATPTPNDAPPAPRSTFQSLFHYSCYTCSGSCLRPPAVHSLSLSPTYLKVDKLVSSAQRDRMDVMNDRSTGSSKRKTGIVCREEHRKKEREENKVPLRPWMSPDRVNFSSSAQHQPSHGSSLTQRVSQKDQEPQLPSC